MITNLFSIFDPATSTTNAFNWCSLLLVFLITPFLFWVTTNQKTFIFISIKKYVFNEFKPLSQKQPHSLIIILSLFLLVALNNAPGLLPYVFTRTRHISTTLRLALPLWLGVMLHGWVFNTSNLLVHLIPSGTPFILIPFIVIIETIRRLIRPITLAIRLAANIVAGHLLISLLTSARPLTGVLLSPVLFRGQLALAVLEVAVAFIQAYVFRVLMTLYTTERIS